MAALSDPSKIDHRFTFAVGRDKREQLGWTFAPNVPTVDITMKSGDYTVIGHETEIAIERKSLADLVGSITWGNVRFQKELERLRSYRLAAVVIEASPADVEGHRYFAKKVEPSEVFAIVAALHVKHGVPFMFGGTRKHAASSALLLLNKFWRMRRTELAAVETKELEASILARGDK
jgi:ERCC4-type nuclease